MKYNESKYRMIFYDIKKEEKGREDIQDLPEG